MTVNLDGSGSTDADGTVNRLGRVSDPAAIAPDQSKVLAGFRREDFPVAEEIARTELSLPLHPHMTGMIKVE